jgi:cobalt-zinc-cadmium efflux system protein
MSHDPHHHHTHEQHSHVPNNKKVLLISFLLISIFMLIEFIGGFITHSLALISDAGHMLSDSVALGIALAAVLIGQKQRNAQKSFGYQRFEILAAALNGLTLIIIAVYIFIEALLRLQQPQEIHVQGMLLISGLGLLINIIVAVMMFKGSDTEHDLNMRGAFLHVISDLLGSVGAIIAALCIYFFAWTWADSLASVLVAILVLRSGVQIALKASHILMQGTPEQFNPHNIEQQLRQFEQVQDVHDLHIWSLSSKHYVLSCHVVVKDDMTMLDVQQLLHRIEHHILDLGIEHVTIQTETTGHHHPDIQQCTMESEHHPHSH